MASRQPIRALRPKWPLLPPHRHHIPFSSLAARTWSYPPPADNVANDEVAKLAASPRRPLTLTDLLKYVTCH